MEINCLENQDNFNLIEFGSFFFIKLTNCSEIFNWKRDIVWSSSSILRKIKSCLYAFPREMNSEKVVFKWNFRICCNPLHPLSLKFLSRYPNGVQSFCMNHCASLLPTSFHCKSLESLLCVLLCYLHTCNSKKSCRISTPSSYLQSSSS